MLDRLASIFPYYINHVIVAALISGAAYLAIGNPFATLAGGAFYAVREVIQRQRKGYWDAKGFAWPVASTALIFLVAVWLG